VCSWWAARLDCRATALWGVAESIGRGPLVLGEAKLSLSAADAVRVCTELEAKARQLPFAGKYKYIDTGIFVAQDPPPDAISIDWCGE
jgi:hypothetical protein